VTPQVVRDGHSGRRARLGLVFCCAASACNTDEIKQ
jgi:hypothetical protein